MNVDLTPGTEYTAAELRETFGKQRAGKGIEILYNENDNQYLRLFSKEESEYGDDLEADPMRYVGEKDFNNPKGDQVLNRGNEALAYSQRDNLPVFLFEKVSENPVRHLFHGRVEVVDFEHNYRPEKDKKEYDFYLRRVDMADEEVNTVEQSSDEDLAPGPLRDIDPESRETPEPEEQIEYESNKQSQAEALNEHEDTVAQFRDELEKADWECKETDETDILATAEDAVLVLEVKSIDDSNERRQIRKAMGQVFENSYRDVVNRGWGDRDLIPGLAFSRVPSDRFSGYLEFLQSEGIETLWRTDDEISGHPDSVSRVFE
jgi:hypothetical protein